MKHVPLKVFNRQGVLVGPLDLPRVEKTDQEWQEQLTPEQFAVARAHGTERPFCGTLLDNKRSGVYACVCCGLPLFASNAKFESGTGWPSFFRPLDNAVGTSVDDSYFMKRTEVHCSNCGGHLGHVFPDGPNPTGLRFCMNGVALAFVAE